MRDAKKTGDRPSRKRDSAGPGRRLLVGSLLVAVGLSIYGFGWMTGFAASAVASAAGIFVTIPVTVWVIERILDDRRTQQWELVARQTAKSIEGHAQHAAFDFHTALSDRRRQDIPSPAVLPQGGHGEVLGRIASALEERSDDRDPAVLRLHDRLQPTLQHLGGMAPRIYSSVDPTLAELFGALEEEVRGFERARYLYEDERPEALWTHAASTARALGALVDHVQS